MTVKMCASNFKVNMKLLVIIAIIFMKSAQNVWLTQISLICM